MKQNDNLCPLQDSGSLAVFKVTARNQGHYKEPSGHLLHTVTFLVFFFCFVFLFVFFFLLLLLLLLFSWRGEGFESEGWGKVGGAKNAKLQTRAITEFMYTTYSFCYTLHYQEKASLVNNF